MIAHRSLKGFGHVLLASAFALSAYAAQTDISTEPLNTYSAPSSTDVKPNVLFVLDDSGSMDWNYMPDQVSDYWATSYLYKNSAFNGVAYNPAITYQPPVNYSADGTLDTTTYPSMTGASTASGADSTTKPNWKVVPRDGYRIQSTSTDNLTNNAYAYVIIPGEYCSAASLRTCTTASASSTGYTYPATLRWCPTSALTSCRATYDGSSYAYPRIPAPRTATITISGTSSTSVSNVRVNSLEILSATTTASIDPTVVASRIRDNINNCSNSINNQCTTVGYSATASGSVVTIYAPGAITDQPQVTQTGSMTLTATNFSVGTVPGDNLRTTITSSVTSYPYPGTSSKASTRTDCAASTCTYAEEMTNYANWWAYYHTRMQMMKSSTSNAFSTIDSATDLANSVSRFRVGFMSINNNTSGDFLNLAEFKTTQKGSWFSKLFSAIPNNSTPLREALSTAGRLYAGKLNGTTLNGSEVIDPLQFSCQQNYTILSTDGYWNGASGYKLNGTTAMDNQDAALPAPYNDGGSANVQARTSSLQSQTSQLLASTSTLQTRTSNVLSSTSNLQVSTSNLQASTSTLQKRNYSQLQTRTSTNSGSSWTGWSDTSSCAWDTGGSSRRDCQYTGTTWSAWSDASSCLPQAIGTGTSGTWKPGVDCQYTAWTAFSDAASCTPAAQDTSGTWSVGTARQCQYTAWSAWANAASTCTPVAQDTSGTWSVGTATQCQYTAYTTAAPADSCTAAAKSTSSPYTRLVATTCSYAAWTAWADAASTCTTVAQSSSGTYNPTATGCQYTATTAAPVASCTSVPISGSSPYSQLVATTCSYQAYSTWANASSCTLLAKSTASPYTVGTATNCQYTAWSGWTSVPTCTAAAKSTSPNYTVATATECQTPTTGGTSDTLADVAAYYYGKDLRDSTAVSPDATGTCTGPIIPPATIANDLCANNVPPNGLDVAQTQHMTTFTLGLGSQGQMVYSSTYPSDLTGDFYDITKQTTAAPSSGICSWMTSGSACTWPTPSSNSINNIDDLWHAAVNGRGTYYSATDPTSLATGLSASLATIINTPRPGTAAAAASSNPNISTSDNYVFSSSYKSVEWYGEVIRQTIDSTGALSAQQWSAMRLLDCATTVWAASTRYAAGSVFRNGSACYAVNTEYVSGTAFGTTDTTNATAVSDASGSAVVPQTSRTIYTKGASGLIPFLWADLVSAALDANFIAPALTYTSATAGLSQFCSTSISTCLSTTQQSNNTIASGGAAGEALVNFLRGDRTYENTFYRQRTHVMGDIVSSEGRYVKTPLFNYTDANYSAFKTSMAARSGKVYVSANDGMLHAFDGETGQETWAYVPSFVLPNIYKLADKNYNTQHQYFVDNSPETGDICPTAPTSTCSDSEWKTILVGGLNRGGKGYFALDVTDPANPILLWEYTETNLGYTYGNPKITKLRNGTWVVIFASGYNSADGVGRLYVVNANTGALIRTISTGVGTTATPSGLARISAHSPTASTDNTTAAVYGGDMLGNVWRFDINDTIAPSGYEAQLLVTLKDSLGNIQPITAKPTVSTIDGKPVVFMGTGRYLGISDLSDSQVQTFYAIKDNSDSTTFGNPRTTTNGFVQQTLSSGTCPDSAPTTVCTPGQAIRGGTSNEVDWTTKNGWFIDFLSAGERSTTDSALALGTLLFTTIYPNNSSASACGTETSDTSASYVYSLNYKTGAPASDGVSGVSLGNVIATRPVIVGLGDGTLKGLIRTSGGGSSSGTDLGGTTIVDAGRGSSSTYAPGPTRRVSWRELINE